MLPKVAAIAAPAPRPKGDWRPAGQGAQQGSPYQRERSRPYRVDLRYLRLRALKSFGNPSTEPMRSAIASSVGDERSRVCGLMLRRSRTTSDLESFRRRDSPSISATSASGNLTVKVFMADSVLRCRHMRNTPRWEPGRPHVRDIAHPTA